MTGLVSAREVFLHPFLIVRLFGLPCLARCVWAVATRRHETFLALAWKGGR
jgi:hypothetical protein